MWVVIAIILFLGASGVSVYAMSLRRKAELLRLSNSSNLANSYAIRRQTRWWLGLAIGLLVASIVACLLPLFLA